jgi:Flp pilus assembly protein TadB
MSAATAGILGALVGLGVVLIVAGLRRTSVPRPDHRPSRIARKLRQETTMPRVAATLITAAVVAAVTRWPAGTVLAGLAAWFLPRALGPDREHARALERIEAIASWIEMLRDTIAAAAGLEQAILAAEPVAPTPIREHVVLLAARIRRGERLPAALRAFAAEIADPTADLVVAALLLAAEQQARDLAQLLGSLADSARQHAVMRMRVAAGRARVRTAARIIIAVTMILVIGLLLWSRAFLQPYGTAAGQLMLLLVGACFATGFWWLHRISVMRSDPRLLTNLAGVSADGGNGARG